MIKRTAPQRATGFSAACVLAVALQWAHPLAFAQASTPAHAQITSRLDQVSKMLAGAASRDANAVWDAKTEIEELPYPARGDRKLARRLNTTALEKFKAGQVADSAADFEKARRAGFAQSQYKVGHAYEYGWGGTQDKAAAAEWYKKAALQGLEPAKDALKRLGVSDF